MDKEKRKVSWGEARCELCGYSAPLHKRVSTVARVNRFCDETGLCCIRNKSDICEVKDDEFCDYFKKGDKKCQKK